MPGNDDLPDFRHKRKVLFGEKTSREELREMGSRFMEHQRYDDALEFFQRAEAQDLVRQIVRRAIESGNTPLLMRAKKILEEDVAEEEWNEVGQAAEQAGLFSAAHLAHRQAGHEGEAERLRRKMAEVQELEAPTVEPVEEAHDGNGRGEHDAGLMH
ncbi:MAG: hypothetical protein R6V05_10800 [Candidatus Brocadiia bacterium]